MQSRVSELETGTQLPSERDIREWVAANATGDMGTELLEPLAAARMEYATHRDAVRHGGGLANVQAQAAALEQQVMRIAEWQPAMVPGLVQTPAYARKLLALSFTISDDEEIEAVIVERQNSVLYRTGRRIQLIVGEAALRNASGTIDTLLGQLDRLVSAAGLATVELGRGALRHAAVRTRPHDHRGGAADITHIHGWIVRCVLPGASTRPPHVTAVTTTAPDRRTPGLDDHTSRTPPD